MRLLFILGILVAFISASDMSFCKDSCARKTYDSDAKITSCLDGCAFRESGINGPNSFLQCQKKCDEKYTQRATSVAAPCHFACALPRMKMLYMSYTVTKDRDTEMRTMNGNDKKMKMSFDEEFNKILASFIKGRTDIITENKLNEHTSTDGRVLTSRPRGHIGVSANGPFVGNTLPDGSPKIVSHTVYKEDEQDQESLNDEYEAFYEKLRHQKDFQPLIASLLMVGILVAFGLLYRLMTLRRERYEHLQNPTFLSNKLLVNNFSPRTTSARTAAVPTTAVSVDQVAHGIPPPAYTSTVTLNQNEH